MLGYIKARIMDKEKVVRDIALVLDRILVQILVGTRAQILLRIQVRDCMKKNWKKCEWAGSDERRTTGHNVRQGGAGGLGKAAKAEEMEVDWTPGRDGRGEVAEGGI